jgi:GNAT superfamily N-acetyltransferase
VVQNFLVRRAGPADADDLLAVRRDAIMGLSDKYGFAEADRWASAQHATRERAVESIAVNHVWVAESAAAVIGWVEVHGATIESLYVRSSAARGGIGSCLLEYGERHIHDGGASSANLEASPNALQFYAQRGYLATGEPTPNNATPMTKSLVGAV